MDSGLVLFNQIGALVTEVNTSLLRRPVVRGTVTSQVAWVRTGVTGGEVVYPVRFFSNGAKRRGAFDNIPATSPEFVNFSASLHRWAPDAEMIPQGTELSDVYSVLQGSVDQLLMQAANEYEHQLAAFLGNGHQSTEVETADGILTGGPTKYDKLPFFHTAKLVNPNRAVGTFSNFDGSLALNRAGLVKAFGALDSVKGPDGRPMRMPGKIVVVVTNEDQYDRASVLLNGGIRATAVGNSAAASESNSETNGKDGGEGGGLRGRAELIKLPDLADYDGGKGWYAFKIASAEHRPITVNVAQAPLVYVSGLNPNEFSRVTSDTTRYGWNGYWGLGYAWPQLAFKGIEP